VSGKIVGTDNNDNLHVLIDFADSSAYGGQLSGQVGTFDLDYWQIEVGEVATPLEIRPRAVEFALCQRFYEKSYLYDILPGTGGVSDIRALYGRRASSQQGVTGSTTLFASTSFAVQKRVIPTVAVYAPNSGTAGQVGVDDNSGVLTNVINIGESAFEMYWTPGSSRWGGWWHFAADSEIG